MILHCRGASLSTSEGRTLASVKQLFRIEKSEELDQLGDHSCPSRLVACAQARAVVPMEVLVEEDVISPVGIGLEFLRSTIDGTLTLFITQEDTGQTIRDLFAYIEEVHHLA